MRVTTEPTHINRFTIKGYPCAIATGLAIGLLLTGCQQKKQDQRILPQDQLTVDYSIDRNTILVGEPVELTVTAYFPTNGVLKLPEIGDGKNIVLLKRNWENIERDDGLHQSESHYSITSFRIGDHIVSTNVIRCTMGDRTVSTNFPQVSLTVNSALESDASSKIADIKPIQKLPGRIPLWAWMVPAIALAAFLIGLISSKLWKNRENLIPVPPPIPPHILALKALDRLMGKGLLEKNECEPFYTELSVILRTYLEGRFNLNAPDETTEEIVEEMSRSAELNGTQRNILQDFMRQADEVKFAKGHPDRSTMEAAFKTTTQFVEETKETEKTEEDNA